MQIKPRKVSSEEQANIYLKFRPLARRVAIDTFKRHRLMSRDLFIMESQSILGEIIAKWNDPRIGYDKTKSSEISWLYKKLHWGLRDFIRRERRHHIPENDFGVPQIAPPPHSWVERFLQTMSDDAKVMVTTILNAPADFAADLSARRFRAGRTKIKKHLQKRGWSESRIFFAWKEIKECL